MRPVAIVNCDVYTPEEVIPSGLVLIQEGVIRTVGASASIALPIDTLLVDAERGRVTPGLIDLALDVEEEQTWGAPETLGVTSYLRQVTIRDEGDLPRLAGMTALMARPAAGARPLGLHIIGPWREGGDPTLHWRDLWTAADGTIRVITLDPRLAGDNAPISELIAAGVTPVVELAGRDNGGTVEPAEVGHTLRQVITPEAGDQNPAIYLGAPPALATAAETESLPPASPDRLILTSRGLQRLSTHSIREQMAATDMDFASALSASTCYPAALLGLPLGRLATGAPADLICWSRFGELAWTMVGGAVVYPSSSPSIANSTNLAHRPPSQLDFREATHDRALTAIRLFLQAQEATIAVNEERQAAGVDLSWRYRDGPDHVTRTSLVVHIDHASSPERLYLATESDHASERSGFLTNTAADWLFYYFPACGALYCLPVRTTRRWFSQHAPQFPRFKQASAQDDAEVSGRVVVAADLLAAIPSARRLSI